MRANKNRGTRILKEFNNNLINKINLDPILQTFKSNKMLKEFYMERIYEILRESLSHEREEYIESINNELENHKIIIQNKDKELIELRKKLTETEDHLEKRDEQTKSLKSVNEEEKNHKAELKLKLKEKNNEINEIKSSLEKQIGNYKYLSDSKDCLKLENSSLEQKIEILEQQIKKKDEKILMIKILEDELQNKEYLDCRG